jgi:hypothetical protein
MKKNIPFAMLLRAIRYCSTFKVYLQERESLRMALLLNKYPGDFIDKEFTRVFLKFNINLLLTSNNYNVLRNKIIETPIKDVPLVDHEKMMFVHLNYCRSMQTFPMKFHDL